VSARDGDVALVHDYLLVARGAERTFAAIADCWPRAPIFTLLYEPRAFDERLASHAVQTSYLQRLGVRQRGFRRLLPLMPTAVERLDLGEHRLVVSSSSAFAHGVHKPPGAIHVSYCHSPFRYVWHERERGLEEVPNFARRPLARTLDHIRGWDLRASEGVDHYIANSEITRARIAEFWGRDATVLHPPVETDRFAIGSAEDWFLMVMELVPHKQVDLALAAAAQARRRVRVVGAGPERRPLEAAYGATAQFLGRVDDEQLADLYARARALIVPNVEEFGIAAVEAQAAGRPVLAAGAGGARETVIEGRTGALFPPGDVSALARLMTTIDFESFNPRAIAEHAQRWSVPEFQRRFRAEVERVAATPS
jgi:glycosyltransferase involved in cell wall biosynthesis